MDTDGAIVGMLTEGDLLRGREGYTEKQARLLDMLAEGQELAPAFLQAILDRHNRVKNVLRNGKLVGIVPPSDLIRALAQALETKSPSAAARHGP